MKARIGSLFTGYGGLDRAVTAHYGGSVAWHSEIDPAASKLLARHHPDIPNLGDITAIDWATVEPVDIITGGFPCQDLSVAGHRAGLTDGTRSGLWLHMARAIEALQPAVVVIENVGGIRSAAAHSDLERDCWCVGGAGGGPVLRALGAVLGSLAGLGFDARWGSVRASDAGAPHRRERVFIAAAHPHRVMRDGCGAAGPGRRAEPADRGGGPVTLLPTPAVVDMGRGKSVQEWDDWTGRMQARHGNGNGHGRSLEIEAQRFGPYQAAIARWETVLGRPAPPPTEPGTNGGTVLSPAFVEHMMGLPAGWVTALPIPRSAQLKLLGNGVVQQQAALALQLLDEL